MPKQDLMDMFDTIEAIFSHPGLLGFTPLVADLRHAVNTKAGYPPRNVIKTGDDSWILEVAVSGFSPDDIDVEVDNGHLNISGQSCTTDSDKVEYLYQGLARRNFKFTIRLGEHVNVSKKYPPFMQHGMLMINLEREIPEALKPKKFDVISIDHLGKETIDESPEVSKDS